MGEGTVMRPSPAFQRYADDHGLTIRSFTVRLPVDPELVACVAECDGDQTKGVKLWLMRRGERARQALEARVRELYG